MNCFIIAKRNIKTNFDSRKRKDKDIATYMNVIFDAKNATRLSQIAKMLYIDSISMDGNQYHKYLQEKYREHHLLFVDF